MDILTDTRTVTLCYKGDPGVHNVPVVLLRFLCSSYYDHQLEIRATEIPIYLTSTGFELALWMRLHDPLKDTSEGDALVSCMSDEDWYLFVQFLVHDSIGHRSVYAWTSYFLSQVLTRTNARQFLHLLTSFNLGHVSTDPIHGILVTVCSFVNTLPSLDMFRVAYLEGDDRTNRFLATVLSPEFSERLPLPLARVPSMIEPTYVCVPPSCASVYLYGRSFDFRVPPSGGVEVLWHNGFWNTLDDSCTGMMLCKSGAVVRIVQMTRTGSQVRIRVDPLLSRAADLWAEQADQSFPARDLVFGWSTDVWCLLCRNLPFRKQGPSYVEVNLLRAVWEYCDRDENKWRAFFPAEGPWSVDLTTLSLEEVLEFKGVSARLDECLRSLLAWKIFGEEMDTAFFSGRASVDPEGLPLFSHRFPGSTGLGPPQLRMSRRWPVRCTIVNDRAVCILFEGGEVTLYPLAVLQSHFGKQTMSKNVWNLVDQATVLDLVLA